MVIDQCLFVGISAFTGDSNIQVAGDAADAPVPQLDQVADGSVDAFAVGGCNRRVLIEVIDGNRTF